MQGRAYLTVTLKVCQCGAVKIEAEQLNESVATRRRREGYEYMCQVHEH